ncbi:MAG: response regulator [Clostridia bacterium]|nr:response regulator [Clostridia bacterium]
MITLTVDDNPIIVESVREELLRLDPKGNHHTSCSGEEALKLSEQLSPDVIFLDIEMPDWNGLEIAKRLKTVCPRTNIVFITGHAEYALSAFEIYASGFLLKPITQDQLRRALDNLRYPLSKETEIRTERLKVCCFGQFEVWHNGRPVAFQRSKTKELFAYLIDRNGAMCTTQQLISILWPDAPGDASHASQLRVFIADLQTTLTRLGFGAALARSWGMLGIDPAMMDCDYYRYLSGDAEEKRLFHGEYMTQYSFGEPTLARLIHETELIEKTS